MADLRLTTPVTVNGNSYPYVAFQMIVNPIFANGGFKNTGLINFTPYRTMPNGTKEVLPYDPNSGLQPAVQSIGFDDMTALAQRDPDFAKVFGGFLMLVQEFILKKGI